MYAMASLASSMELIPLWGRPEWKRRPLNFIFHIIAEAVPVVVGGMSVTQDGRQSNKLLGYLTEVHNLLTYAGIDVCSVHPVDGSVLEVVQFPTLHHLVHTHSCDCAVLFTVCVWVGGGKVMLALCIMLQKIQY